MYYHSERAACIRAICPRGLEDLAERLIGAGRSVEDARRELRMAHLSAHPRLAAVEARTLAQDRPVRTPADLTDGEWLAGLTGRSCPEPSKKSAVAAIDDDTFAQILTNS